MYRLLSIIILFSMTLLSPLADAARAVQPEQSVSARLSASSSPHNLRNLLAPPEGCQKGQVRVQNPKNASDTLEVKFCEGDTPGRGSLWLQSHATVAHVVKVFPGPGVGNIPSLIFLVWGPAPGDTEQFWIQISSDVVMNPGEQILIKTSRFGDTLSEFIVATQAHLDLISELLFAGDTPAPDLTKAQQLYRYGMVIAEELPGLPGDASEIFNKCGNAFKRGQWYPIVECITALGSSEEGAKIIRNGLLKVGKDISLDLLEKALKAVDKVKDMTVNIAKIAKYIFEVSDSTQDVDIRVYFPGSGLQPPPPCRLCSDDASFISHFTIPDDSTLPPDRSFIKTWRLRNTGTSTWGAGYQLVFTGGDQLAAPDSVDLPKSVAPGEEVDISVPMRTPSTEGSFQGYWQMRDSQGVYFGDKIWVKINVVSAIPPGGSTGGHIAAFSADPPSPSNANTVRIYARVNWWPQFRAMRVRVDNQIIGETAATEHTFEWNTTSFNAGDHSIVLEVTDQTDTSWSRPERKIMIYTSQGSPQPTNHAPDRPSPASPYDWYVYYSGNTAHLCAQANGDPDGDSITGYYFDIFESAQLWDSGWVSSNCVTTASLGPYNYQWRVKVRDSHGAESDWSDVWHFTIVNPNLSINELYFQPQDSDSEQVKIRACTTGQGGVGITMRVSVNDASDGSGNGEWHIIKELGVPCFNDTDAPVWHTLEYRDGPHRVRVEAHGSSSGWDGATVREDVYTLPHRRPASPRLLAPVSPSQDIRDAIYLNSRTFTFRWAPALRANTVTLHVSTRPSPEDDPNPVFRQTFNTGTTEHTVTFDQDYPALYWQVSANNDKGTNASGDQLFGIDRVAPTCQVQPLRATTYETVFQVSWSGSDNLSGVHSFDIQYLDSERGAWEDWLTDIPAPRTYALFTGRTGHTYAFRCRATDNANNTGNYPSTADTSTKVDPTARPQTPWWNNAYASKRNLTILNNMPNVTLPAGYPVHLHFDSTTAPTAAELYNASRSTPKCNDLRIVYNDTTELDRVVQTCNSNAIDIWFRTQVSIPGGSSNNAAHQLYYGNPNAGSPPGSPSTVFDPPMDANTVGLWYMDEGSGSVLHDASGHGNNCTLDPSTSWLMPAKFTAALRFQGGTDGPTVNCGASPALNLQSFTFEMWFRRTGNAWGRLAGQMQRNVGQRWILEFEGGRIRALIWTGAGDRTFYTTTNFQGDTNWHHLALAVNGTAVSLYIDGHLERGGTLPAPIRSANLPLTIGSAEDIMRTFAEITHVRFSNIARTDFQPYAAFGAITAEPTVAAGAAVAPPVTGTADMAVLGLTTYPNPDGGLLVQAVIKNQGDLDTRNGFYTDLYVDHLPAGPGDYTGSIRFWVEDPIAAGATVTLTTVITDISGLRGMSSQSLGASAEFTGTLYMQADSTGAIAEPDELNNISTDGTQICLVSPDAYELDDTADAAQHFSVGDTQLHNVSKAGDQDWMIFNAQAGETYLIRTFDLGPAADTYLYLYDTDGTTLLASNDDHGGGLSSEIEWTAPGNGAYYVMVKHWNPNVAGCGTEYSIEVRKATRLQGQANLQGRGDRGDPRWANYPLTVTLFPAGGTTPVLTGTVTLDAQGSFTLTTYLDPGTYDIQVRGRHSLSNRVEGVTLPVTGPINLGMLLEGDANGDEKIDILDFSLLSMAFGLRQGDARYNQLTDFNDDGKVDILDFSLLSMNFNRRGPVVVRASGSSYTFDTLAHNKQIVPIFLPLVRKERSKFK